MHEQLQRMREKMRKVPIHHWVLFAIMAIGVFLRTYEFRDWMIFNPDQARDAIVVHRMVDGTFWPEMGPQAGSTEFQLGPIFYYFEFVSAWLFGSSAQSMAYPDLLFSILAIPLAYVLFRRFFDEYIALSLTLLFSSSFFVVTYSRFAFNPNSIPFFTLLFILALSEIVRSLPKERTLWAALAGIAMGVGFQLHTILLVSMPLMALAVCLYIFSKKQFIWKSIFVVILFFLLLNANQFFYDMENGWSNMNAFFSDAGGNAIESEGNSWKYFSNNALCHIQGNVHILSSFGGGDKCELTTLFDRIVSKGWIFNVRKLFFVSIGAIFLVGGWVLALRYMKKEKSLQKKQLFWLVASYSVIIFAVLFPVSSSLSIRYFIAIEFIPFLLLGFWIRFIMDNPHKKLAISLSVLLVVSLMAFNMQSIWTQSLALTRGNASDSNFAFFGEVEEISRYVIAQSGDSDIIYLYGRDDYLSRFDRPLSYFTEKEGKLIRNAYHREQIGINDPFFYIADRGNKRIYSSEILDGFMTEDIAVFGGIAIAKIIKRPQ